MPTPVQGLPCWADVMLPDLAAGMRFYGELLGWTFREGEEQYGAYANALCDGELVAGLMAKRNGRMPTAWNIYFAVDDAVAIAERIQRAGGQLIQEPASIGDLGVVAVAADPGGAVFGIWQAGRHRGFGRRNEPGTFGWTEVYTRDKDAVDAFYRQVFGYRTERLVEVDGTVDYTVWVLERGDGEQYVGGRYQMGSELPAELPAHFRVYFVVADCDDAVASVVRLGGRAGTPPKDSPYGRWASVADDQGAWFTVIDTSRRVWEPQPPDEP